MMGQKTLGEIRAELEESLAKRTASPIQLLEQQIQELERKNKGKPGSTKVLESLLHLLQRGKTKKRRKRRAVRSRK